MFAELPTARNSNLLPVKANGLVRLRSPASFGSGGRTETPVWNRPPCLDDLAPPFSICSNTSLSWSPRKIEMIAGGASLAPRRWSLWAEAIDRRRISLYLSTARMTAVQKTRNWALSCGLSPGFSRFSPVSVDIDQLLCLPEPLIPANGFSWSRQARPYLGAIFRSSSMIRFWWSVARFEFSNVG